MNLRPFFCYFGGKWREAPKYPAPEHPQIVEPFAGAAGYSTRYHDRKILLVEKDAKIAALWRFLISVSPQEIRNIPLLSKDQTVDDLHVCEEAKILVGFWLNKGVTQPQTKPSAWMRSGEYLTSFWGPSIRERIARQVEQIRHWQILEGSYETAPELTATWFIDPPYQRAGRRYKHNGNGIGFTHLAEWSRQRQGFTMVCENEGAEWLPFKPFLVLRSLAGRRGGRDSAEALWQQRTGLLEWIGRDYARALQGRRHDGPTPSVEAPAWRQGEPP